MEMQEFVKQAKRNVLIAEGEQRFFSELDEDDLFIVWSNYTLGNLKCLIGNKKNSLYFEVTYNDHDKQMYVDCYEKVYNVEFNVKDVE